jgi:hypothetical protein
MPVKVKQYIFPSFEPKTISAIPSLFMSAIEGDDPISPFVL